jgi:Tetratricopeptide repeat
MIGQRTFAFLVLAALALHAGLASEAVADTPSASAVREASKHFQRGVTLYNEADYRAALVEFKRAYDIAPNATVLYNIGQTYFQLQNYAAALTTLDRFLAEAGPNAARRTEVEQTVDTLQSRVGKIAIKTDGDCEIAVDDEPVGKTPLREPVLVSIGRRKVTAMRDDRVVETRFVDVAAGDTVQLQLSISEGSDRPSTTPAPPERKTPSSGLKWGWVATGVLAAGAIGSTVFALKSSSDLKNARGTYPASPQDLADKSSAVKLWSTIADLTWVATAVTGGITLTLTLTKSKQHEVRVGLAPNGLRIAGAF